MIVQLEWNVKNVSLNESLQLKLHFEKQQKGKQSLKLFMGINEAENFAI